MNDEVLNCFILSILFFFKEIFNYSKKTSNFVKNLLKNITFPVDKQKIKGKLEKIVIFNIVNST